MPYKHLFIFPNHTFVRDFFHGLEERMMYTTFGTGKINRSSLRLTMMNNDGQHEVTVTTVENIRHDRMRGLYFDKVSVHEAVELDWFLHDFIQMATYRGFNRMKVFLDRSLRDDEMYFIREPTEPNPHLLDAIRYGLMDIKAPEIKGIFSDLSI